MIEYIEINNKKYSIKLIKFKKNLFNKCQQNI